MNGGRGFNGEDVQLNDMMAPRDPRGAFWSVSCCPKVFMHAIPRFTASRVRLSRPSHDLLVAVAQRSTTRVGLLGVLGLLLSAGACQSSGASTSQDSATNDADGGPGSLVWTNDATKVVVEDQGGGFTGPPPTGSECGRGVGSYTFTVADSQLAWHVCDTTGAIYTFTDGARTLGDTDRTSLIAALKTVTISEKTTCGADKSSRQMVVTRPTGETTYLDSFYACLARGVYVDGIDDAFAVAGTLAQ